jgi:leucyl aminopeptidase
MPGGAAVKITVGPQVSKAGAVRIRFVEKEARKAAAPGVSETEFSAKTGTLCYLRHEQTLLVGAGESAKLDANKVRQLAGTATMFLKKIGAKAATLTLDDWPEWAGAAVEGVLLADYKFDAYKEKKSAPIESLAVEVPEVGVTSAKRAVERARIVAESTNFCRGIGNLPANVLYPKELAARAMAEAKRVGLRVKVYDEKELKAGRFGGLLAVGCGSAQPPRLIVLEHRGGKKGERPIAFVGKAITFDTGGISIKPAANMEEMIFDKCGGMAVLGAMTAIARLKVKRNVVGIIASAENMPSATAYRPGDIVTTYDGTHIEIVNTDAEGRVVLADALAYARRNMDAAAIVDLATLTGACGVALGECAAGLWTNDEAFGEVVGRASKRTGERAWPMPMYQEYEEQIQSDVAAIKNSGGRIGGACTAAAFLKKFVGETPWVHLDIAYMSHRERDQAHLARGATGYGVRILVELAENGIS